MALRLLPQPRPDSRAQRQRNSWEDVLAFLRRRQGLLDGVVFSGGEPTLQASLVDAMREVRAFRFKVGLHTGGAYTQHLAAAVLPLVDWVGLM